MNRYIDFNYVKENADVSAILAHYHIETNGSDTERRCRCPFHEDVNPSFSINIENGKFQCHAASCGEKGNILDFVAAMEETADLRSASEVIGKICGIALAPPRSGKRKKRKSAKHTETASGSQSEPENIEASISPEPDDGAKPNSPLTFQLQLDPTHMYGATRGLSPEECTRFEMGYCNRGSMKGYWCVPYHNRDGEVVAYVGRYPGDPVPDDKLKYKLPKGFHKNLELFNLHRVAGHAQHVTLVEGVFDAIRLHNLGMPAVALIGTSLSDEQIELLVSAGFRSVTVMLDNDAPDEKTRLAIMEAEKEIIFRLSRHMLVRSVELPDGVDPATAPEDSLRGRVPVFPN